jgi:hypothetical protein
MITDPENLYALVANCHTLAAQYRIIADKYDALARSLLEAQGQPDAQRKILDEAIARMMAYGGSLPQAEPEAQS